MRTLARVLSASLVIIALSTPASALVGGKATATDSALLKLIFNGTTFASIAQNASSAPATVLCVALHTADPGIGGTQSTSEAAYGSYARQSVSRTSGGWTVTGNAVSPVSAIVFPAATSGMETETFYSVAIPSGGSTCTGALQILYRGPITPNVAVSSGVIPELLATTVATEN